MTALRLGCVKYLNARPLIHGWDGPVDFDHPAALCRKLAAGELDAALVSSFEYLRNPIYRIVDDVAIAADGPVYSVIVAHREPIEGIEAITLDPASRTAANLLRCILAEHHFTPRILPSNPPGSPDQTLSHMRQSLVRAQLLIGDQAMEFRAEHPRDYKYWDLGEEWKRMTGLPFVFALWLIRPEVPAARELAEKLRAGRDQNLSALDAVAAAAERFEPEFCARYFRENLRFYLGADEKEGLLRFRSLCEKHGILPPGGSEFRLI